MSARVAVLNPPEGITRDARSGPGEIIQLLKLSPEPSVSEQKSNKVASRSLSAKLDEQVMLIDFNWL